MKKEFWKNVNKGAVEYQMKKTKPKTDIHTQTIDQLVKDLVTKKSIWDREVHLPNCSYECDLYIYNNKTLNLFEIKTTTGTTQQSKAEQQLQYDKIYVPKVYKLKGLDIDIIQLYYAHDFNGKNYKIELIKRYEMKQ